MLIDFHTHAFKPELASRAIPNMQRIAEMTPFGDGTLESLVDNLNSLDVDFAVVLNISVKPESARDVNDWANEVNGHAKKVISFGSVHPDTKNVEDELERVAKMGLKGVKFHPDYQKFFVEEKRAFPIYDACQSLGLIALFHAGFDPISPNLFHASPKGLRTVIDNFPHLKIVAAHMGGIFQWDGVEEELLGKNIFLDGAMCCDRMPLSVAERFVSKHGAEHFLLGSDFPWHTTAMEKEFIESFPITSREKDMILGENAKNLLGL